MTPIGTGIPGETPVSLAQRIASSEHPSATRTGHPRQRAPRLSPLRRRVVNTTCRSTLGVSLAGQRASLSSPVVRCVAAQQRFHVLSDDAPSFRPGHGKPSRSSGQVDEEAQTGSGPRDLSPDRCACSTGTYVPQRDRHPGSVPLRVIGHCRCVHAQCVDECPALCWREWFERLAPCLCAGREPLGDGGTSVARISTMRRRRSASSSRRSSTPLRLNSPTIRLTVVACRPSSGYCTRP